uniref:Uncharacterized protein n=1 Tax=Zea mays TaxID=4577 RepID=B8A1L8_MAIZE|nr:unknown [Zea mays]
MLKTRKMREAELAAQRAKRTKIQYLQRSEYWTHHRTSIQLVLSLGLMFIFLMISLKVCIIIMTHAKLRNKQQLPLSCMFQIYGVI